MVSAAARDGRPMVTVVITERFSSFFSSALGLMKLTLRKYDKKFKERG